MIVEQPRAFSRPNHPRAKTAPVTPPRQRLQSTSGSTSDKFGPLLSCAYELLFPQLLSFHNYLRCPLLFLFSTFYRRRQPLYFVQVFYFQAITNSLLLLQTATPLLSSKSKLFSPKKNNPVRMPKKSPLLATGSTFTVAAQFAPDTAGEIGRKTRAEP